MNRGSFRSCAALLGVLLLTPGCATVVLWDWAGQEETPGQLAGILRDGRGGDMVLYQYESSEEIPGGILGVRLPADWRNRPLRVLTYTAAGEALALAEPLRPEVGISLPSAGQASLRLIDYKTTVGRQLVAFAPGERPYGFVPLMNDAGEVIHELYGYEFDRGQWIRLTTVNLGAYRSDAARIVTGLALTPVTMALDFAIIIGIACAVGQGGSVSGLDFPSIEDGPPHPISVRERNDYWRSLRSASPPGR